MNAIDKIKTRLSAHPDIRYSESLDRIEVRPPDRSGFTVGLEITQPGFTVNFDSWHEEFDSEAEALDCFAFGLSSRCRLAVVLRGDSETSWTVEAFENGAWVRESETRLLLQPFWRSPRVEYRQNRVLDGGGL